MIWLKLVSKLTYWHVSCDFIVQSILTFVFKHFVALHWDKSFFSRNLFFKRSKLGFTLMKQDILWRKNSFWKSWQEGHPDAKSFKFLRSAYFLFLLVFLFRATLFFSKRLTFGYCDVSIIFSVDCKLYMNIYFAETTQKLVVFLRQSWLNPKHVSKSVKMLAISFKPWRNVTIESNIFCYY